MTLENFFFYRFYVLVSLDREVLPKGQNLSRTQLLSGLRLAAEREGCPVAAGSCSAQKPAGSGIEPG